MAMVPQNHNDCGIETVGVSPAWDLICEEDLDCGIFDLREFVYQEYSINALDNCRTVQ